MPKYSCDILFLIKYISSQGTIGYLSLIFKGIFLEFSNNLKVSNHSIYSFVIMLEIIKT